MIQKSYMFEKVKIKQEIPFKTSQTMYVAYRRPVLAGCLLDLQKQNS